MQHYRDRGTPAAGRTTRASAHSSWFPHKNRMNQMWFGDSLRPQSCTITLPRLAGSRWIGLWNTFTERGCKPSCTRCLSGGPEAENLRVHAVSYENGSPLSCVCMPVAIVPYVCFHAHGVNLNGTCFVPPEQKERYHSRGCVGFMQPFLIFLRDSTGSHTCIQTMVLFFGLDPKKGI
jgi:hypothetical protein